MVTAAVPLRGVRVAGLDKLSLVDTHSSKGTWFQPLNRYGVYVVSTRCIYGVYVVSMWCLRVESS